MADGVDVVREPVCFACRHLIYWPYCAAFPDGIPDQVRQGQDDHRKPIEGDRGIQFELAPAGQSQKG
jgi:hypothetical protein